MKDLPTVITSQSGNSAVLVESFEGMEHAGNRDATDFLFVGSNAEAKSRPFIVRFSGTVMAMSPEAFGFPLFGDREATFRTFAEAAIGDYLDEHQSLELGGHADYLAVIDCFTPHFQAWSDRAAASIEDVDAYLSAHVHAAMRFGLPNWVLGWSDLLRLHQTFSNVERRISLREGEAWKARRISDAEIDIVPLGTFVLDAQRRKNGALKVKEATVLYAEPRDEVASPILVYVDPLRIADLRRVDSTNFDLRKLIALCEELNQCYRAQCYHSVAALTRAIMDHVPPIFGYGSFVEVASNVGPKSFKDSMQHLQNGARKIADQHLHGQVRAKESLPTRVQVDFSQTLDVLLGEIVRLLQ